MTGLIVMMVVITCDDKFSVIGEELGLNAIAHMPPAIIAPFAGKPFILGVSEQDLAMLRRPQNVESQPFRSRRDEGATSDCAAAGHPVRTANSNAEAGPRNDFNISELFLNTVSAAC